MIRVERHQLHNRYLDRLCFLSKNLYNYANFLIRQEWINTRGYLNAYELVGKLAAENQPDYRALPSNVSQQIIYQLFKNWKSFYRASKDYQKHPEKYKARPKMPQYKHKTEGRNLLIFTRNACRLKAGYIHFANDIIKPIRTKGEKIKQARLVPQSSSFVLEVVYEKEKKHHELSGDRYVSVDLGVDNLATLVTNLDSRPLLVNGRIVKSWNQYYNKRKAYLASIGASRQIRRLGLKRLNKITDYFHKTSRFIITYCLEHQIKVLIVGYNKDWKQEVNLGRVNNQKFASIPYQNLIQQLQYKAEEVGIEVALQEESYTSKCDALALEEVCQHEQYLGRRVRRGLFQSSVGRFIKADVNGALNILRKGIGDHFVRNVVGDDFARNPLNRGFADNPVKVDFLHECSCLA
jgi:putative transposase